MSELISKVNAVIDAISDNMSLKQALEISQLKAKQFFRVISESPTLEALYIRAQHARTELMADEIIEITDTEPDPNRARVRADARKWYASKLQPSKFGDRLDLNVNQTVDVGSALAEARKRALLTHSTPTDQFTQAIDVTPNIDTQTTEDNSVETRDADINEMEDLLK